jgi:hypothetical protein
MLGKESDLFGCILLSIRELAGALDFEHTASTKQHGLPRQAVKGVVERRGTR